MAVKKPKLTIAFDLDGIFVDAPPFVPKKLLEWLFRGWQCQPDKLCYRFPHSRLEQRIRKLSHYYLFRPPIKSNIAVLRRLAQSGQYRLILISARYAFIHPETERWLVKREIRHMFNDIFLNTLNLQPHVFKQKQIMSIRPNYYLEDDYHILRYLTKYCLNTKILFVNKKKGIKKALHDL